MIDTLEPNAKQSSPPGQLSRLEAQEALVCRHLASYQQAGAALAAIRVHRLYRARGFRSFGAYCHGRLAMTRQYADRIIRAATAAWALEQAGLPVPLRCYVALVLSQLNGQRRRRVWQEALDLAGPDRQPTARMVLAVMGEAPPASAGKRTLTRLVGALELARRLLAGMRGDDVRHVGEVVDRAAELAARLAV